MAMRIIFSNSVRFAAAARGAKFSTFVLMYVVGNS